MKLSRNKLRQIILEELMSEDDMALFDPPKPSTGDFGGGEETPAADTGQQKKQQQLSSAMALIENISTSVEELAEMAKSVGWGDLKTHVPQIFPAMEDLEAFADDLQHRVKGR